MFSLRLPRLRPFLSLLALLSVAALLTACEAGLPSAEQIADRMAETYRDPGRLHVVSYTSTEIEADTELGALQLSLTMDSEQWQDGPERVRSESHMSIGLEAPEDAEAAMALAMVSMFGLDEIEMLVVRDGDDVWSWMDLLNTWSHQTVDELDTPGFDMDELADVMGATVETVVAHYDLSYVGQETIAGREAFVVTAAPKAGGEPALLFDFAVLEQAELAVDSERYYVLRSDVTLRPDWDAAMQTAQSQSGDAVNAQMEAQMAETVADLPDVRFTVRSEVQDITFDAEIDPVRFVFTPPEGATEMDADSLAGLGSLPQMGGASSWDEAGEDGEAGLDFEIDEAELEEMFTAPSKMGDEVEEALADMGMPSAESYELPTYTPLKAATLPAGCVLGEEENQSLHEDGTAVAYWGGWSRRLIECPSGSAWLDQMPQSEEADTIFAAPADVAVTELPFGEGMATYVELGGGQRWLVWDQGDATVRLSGTLSQGELMLVALGLE